MFLISALLKTWIVDSCYRKVPKFWDARNFAVNYLKFKQRPNLKVFFQKHAHGIAISEDPD